MIMHQEIIDTIITKIEDNYEEELQKEGEVQEESIKKVLKEINNNPSFIYEIIRYVYREGRDTGWKVGRESAFDSREDYHSVRDREEGYQEGHKEGYYEGHNEGHEEGFVEGYSIKESDR